MPLELLEKVLTEACRIDEQASLRTSILHEHSGIDNILVQKSGTASLLDVKRQSTPGEPICLFPYVSE